MRLINKNSKRGIVNLLADFIVSKIDNKENSIFQITDCGSFMVIHGITTSKSPLDIPKIKSDFMDWFGDILKDIGINNLNTIDVIQYGAELESINEGWVDVSKDVFTDVPEPLYELSVTSEFPYGFSLNCGRLMNYYVNYIFNNMYSALGIDNCRFYFTTNTNENEDFDIDIVSDSRIDKESIKSLILDVFDFNLDEFKTRVNDYDLTQDILFPTNIKPYTQQDRLKDVILF